MVIVAPRAKSVVCSYVSLVQTNLGTKSVFVVLLRNAQQTDLAIRIWTILVPIILKKNKNKNGFSPFSYKFLVPVIDPHSAMYIYNKNYIYISDL